MAVAVDDFYATDAVAGVAKEFLESTPEHNELAEWQARVEECRTPRDPSPWYCDVPKDYPQWHHVGFDRRLTLLADRLLDDSRDRQSWAWVVAKLEELDRDPTWADLPLESGEIDMPAVAAAILSERDHEIWRVAYKLGDVTTAALSDLPLELYFHDLGEQ